VVRQGTWATDPSYVACNIPTTNTNSFTRWLRLYIVTGWPSGCIWLQVFLVPLPLLSQPLRIPIMGKESQPQKRRDTSLSSLSAAIMALNLAKDLSGMTPAKAILVSVITLLTMIKVHVVLFPNDTLQAHIESGQHGRRH